MVKNDPERLDSVEDSRDIDDDSYEVNIAEITIKSHLDDIIKEVNSMEVQDRASINSALLGSWHSTSWPIQLSTFLKMYGNGGWDRNNQEFSKSIRQLDYECQMLYNSKADVAKNLDNVSIAAQI